MDEGFIGNILSSLISKDDGWGNGNSMWIIFLFFLFFMNGGWGGYGNRGNFATQQDVSQGFSFNTLENEVRANGRSIADLGYQNLGQSQNVVNAVANTNQNINNLAHTVQEVGCATNRNIDSVRYDMGQNSAMLGNDINTVKYENAQNTALLGNAINSVKYDNAQGACGINRNIDAVRNDISQQTYAITANDTANTQKILDRLCAMESSAKDNTIAQLRQDLQAAQLTIGNANQTANIISAVRPYPIPSVPYTPYYGTTTI